MAGYDQHLSTLSGVLSIDSSARECADRYVEFATDAHKIARAGLIAHSARAHAELGFAANIFVSLAAVGTSRIDPDEYIIGQCVVRANRLDRCVITLRESVKLYRVTR